MAPKKGNIDLLTTALIIALAMTVACIVYLSNFKSAAFDTAYYERQYDENDVRGLFNSSVNLTLETSNLLTYLQSGEGEIQTDFFNQREKTHLAEVRGLFKVFLGVLDGLVILSVLLMFGIMLAIRKKEWLMDDAESKKHFTKRITQLLLWTGYAILGLTALFLVIAFTFDTSFITFHKIFFDTDTWMLDPATDNLIRMFPQEFFFNFVTRIMMFSAGAAAVMIGAGLYVMKKWTAKPKQ